MLFAQSILACPPLALPSPVPRRDHSWRDVCKKTTTWTDKPGRTQTNRKCGYTPVACAGGR